MTMSTRCNTFFNKSLQKQQKYYPAVGLSRQKMYAEKSKKQDFLLVGTYIILWLQIKLYFQMVT